MTSNTVPYTPNQKLHDKAVQLLKDEKLAKADSKTYNEKRKATTEALRPVLTEIAAKFKIGETVGGQSTIKDWCAQYGGITYRRFHQIATGESQTKKVKSLHVGDLVKIDNLEIRLTKAHIAFLTGGFPAPAPKKQTKKARKTSANQRQALSKRAGKYFEKFMSGKIDEAKWMFLLDQEIRRHPDCPEWIDDVEFTRKRAQDYLAGQNPAANALAAATDAAPTAPITVNPAKAQAAPVPQAPRLGQSPLTPGKKYTVRAAASGGYGIFEPLSPFCLQKHLTRDAAWAAIDTVNAVPPPGTQGGTQIVSDAGTSNG